MAKNVRSVFNLVAFLIIVFGFGCSTVNPNQNLERFDSTQLYANNWGCEVSAGSNALVFKCIERNALVPKYGIYNSAAGLMANYYYSPYNKKTDVSFYKVINYNFKEVLDDIITNPAKYGGKELDRYFKALSGNLPYLTHDGKYEGRETLVRIENGNNELNKMKTAGIPLVSYHGSGVYKYEGSSDGFIAKFSKLADSLGGDRLLKVFFKPQITNNSGFEVPDIKGLVNYSTAKENVTGKYKINIVATNKIYAYEIEPSSYVFDSNEKEVEISPIVTIKQKKIWNYSPNIRLGNNDLEITITRISAHSGKNPSISFNFDVLNKGNTYVKVDAFSFHINDSIFTWEKELKLPPTAVIMNERASTDQMKGENVVQREAANLDRYISLDEAKIKQCKIGVSASYKKDGAEKNIFKSVNITYYDMNLE